MYMVVTSDYPHGDFQANLLPDDRMQPYMTLLKFLCSEAFCCVIREQLSNEDMSIKLLQVHPKLCNRPTIGAPNGLYENGLTYRRAGPEKSGPFYTLMTMSPGTAAAKFYY